MKSYQNFQSQSLVQQLLVIHLKFFQQKFEQ